MENKNYFSAILLFILTVAYNISSPAGVVTGNTGFLTSLRFELSNEHPQHQQLIELLKQSILPHDLKQAIYKDLSETSIIYSTEDITYQDLKRKWHFHKDGNYDIIIDPLPNYKAPNLDEAPLAAITVPDRKMVIYFVNNLKNLSVAEKIQLVLHEQCHRLSNIFGEKSQDERFAEAWAHGFYKYLIKGINADSFYKLLKQNSISTVTAIDPSILCKNKQCFPNEKIYAPDFNYYESSFYALLKQEDIITVANEKKQIVMAVKSSVFQDFLPLTLKPYQLVKVPYGDLEQHQNIIAGLDRLKTLPSGLPLKFQATFEKKMIFENDLPKVVYLPKSSDQFDILLNKSDKILNTQPYLKDVEIKHAAWLLYSLSPLKEASQKIIQDINSYLDNYKQKYPDLFNYYDKGPLQFLVTFSVTTTKNSQFYAFNDDGWNHAKERYINSRVLRITLSDDGQYDTAKLNEALDCLLLPKAVGKDFYQQVTDNRLFFLNNDPWRLSYVYGDLGLSSLIHYERPEHLGFLNYLNLFENIKRNDRYISINWTTSNVFSWSVIPPIKKDAPIKDPLVNQYPPPKIEDDPRKYILQIQVPSQMLQVFPETYVQHIVDLIQNYALNPSLIIEDRWGKKCVYNQIEVTKDNHTYTPKVLEKTNCDFHMVDDFLISLRKIAAPTKDISIPKKKTNSKSNQNPYPDWDFYGN